ncbi:MAG TPA: hypothetical protein VGV87_23580, partial [Blastocatellia bacterium]|nr:hypothetical protein [Blastocatellia bacterium]
MKFLKISLLFLFAAALVVPFAFTRSVEGQAATEALTTAMDARQEADNLFNGLGVFEPTPAIDECTNPATAGRSFLDNKVIFEEREEVDEGLGPIYNDVA